MGLVNYWYLRHCLIRIESQNLVLSLILHAHFLYLFAFACYWIWWPIWGSLLDWLCFYVLTWQKWQNISGPTLVSRTNLIMFNELLVCRARCNAYWLFIACPLPLFYMSFCVLLNLFGGLFVSLLSCSHLGHFAGLVLFSWRFRALFYLFTIESFFFFFTCYPVF
jgi:hypothetical protein